MEEKELDTVVNLIAENDYPAALSILESMNLSRLTKEDALKFKECAEALLNQQTDSIRLATNRVVLDLRLGKIAEAQESLTKLMNMQSSLSAGSAERAALENQANYLLLSMPSTDNARMLMACSVIRRNNSRFEQIAPRFSPAVLSPSILRGTKELSEWGKNAEAVASMLSPIVEQCFPEHGKGVLEAAKAEWYFEKNKLPDAFRLARIAAEAPDKSIAFVGYAVLMRLSVIYPDAGPFEIIQQNLENLLKEANNERFQQNFEALKVRMALLMGRTDLLDSWLETAVEGPENAEIPYDRYLLLTKGHVLSATEKISEAILLFDALINVLKSDLRPLDLIEAYCGKAVAEFRNECPEQAMLTIDKALQIGFPYGYLRTFAEWLFPAPELLRNISQNSELSDDMRSYVEKIQQITEEYQPNAEMEASSPVLETEPGIPNSETEPSPTDESPKPSPPDESPIPPPPEESPKRSGKKARERQNASTSA